MKEIVIRIPDSKYKFIMELLKNLPFISVEKVKEKPLSAEEKAIVDDLKEAIEQVKLHEQGLIELQDARSFLLELKKEKRMSKKEKSTV
jgi:hypothetical protein